MAKKFVKDPALKATKQQARLVSEVARDEPKSLQAGGSVKEAGEKMRSLETSRLPVESDHRLVGAVEGNHPERESGGFDHEPETALVRGIMVKKPIIASNISRWMGHGKSCASITFSICPLWTKICASWVWWR